METETKVDSPGTTNIMHLNSYTNCKIKSVKCIDYLFYRKKYGSNILGYLNLHLNTVISLTDIMLTY